MSTSLKSCHCVDRRKKPLDVDGLFNLDDFNWPSNVYVAVIHEQQSIISASFNERLCLLLYTTPSALPVTQTAFIP